ncbi:MAG: hypothetical protein AB8B91_03665 [Rubripirellula sp.]
MESESLSSGGFLRLGNQLRSWMVCAEHERWITAVRRFAPEMMAPLVPAIHAFQPSQVKASLKTKPNLQAVLLWEVRQGSVLDACDNLAQIRIMARQVFCILAVTELGEREKTVLAELGSAAMIRHPEELPALAGMLKTYFNRSSQTKA